MRLSKIKAIERKYVEKGSTDAECDAYSRLFDMKQPEIVEFLMETMTTKQWEAYVNEFKDKSEDV